MRTKTTLAVRHVTRVTRVSRVDSPKTLSVSASRHNRLFLSSPYLCVNKVFICDLLRARFRVSDLVVSKYSITDHSNQLLMLWLSQFSSVKVGECPTFHA